MIKIIRQTLFETIADCGIPETPTNGVVKFNSTLRGSNATYVCYEGCIHNGVVQRVCQGNGQWSDDVPQCKSKLINSLS